MPFSTSVWKRFHSDPMVQWAETYLFGRDSCSAGWGAIMLPSQLDVTGSRSLQIVLYMMGGIFMSWHQEFVISYISCTGPPLALSICYHSFFLPMALINIQHVTYLLMFCLYPLTRNLYEIPSLVCFVHGCFPCPRDLVGAPWILNEGMNLYARTIPTFKSWSGVRSLGSNHSSVVN